MFSPYRLPGLFTQFPNLIAVESTRHGGVSPAPFNTLNLGLSTGDVRKNILENRRRFFTGLGIDPAQVATSHQVHGEQILYADTPGHRQGYDALITNQPGVFVAVSIADCTPILVYDSKNGAVAAIHAGWRGTVAGIVSKTLHDMAARFGTQAADCYAYVGTCIDECAFEVGADVAEHFTDAFKRFDPKKQKFFVDLKAANHAQLRAFGIPDSQLEISPFSTVGHNADYFSHRLERGQTGRMMAGIIRIRNYEIEDSTKSITN
ncbi:MAG: peptidoglycan editing factor PgeF [Cytophagaceae bacterium]|nr:peptidoglycan editing factor PgeF [Cytophagaceae bacterium]